MTELRTLSPVSELSRAGSIADIEEFVRESLAMNVPDECLPGIIDAWRVLADHWAHLNAPEAA